MTLFCIHNKNIFHLAPKRQDFKNDLFFANEFFVNNILDFLKRLS